MFNYFEKYGIETENPISLAGVPEDLIEGAIKLVASIESMSDKQFDDILGTIQKDYTNWINSDRDNYYGALESESRVFSLESAYVKDRNMFKTALIRLRMAMSLSEQGAADLSYISVLKDVGTDRLRPGDSSVVLSKSNIDGYFEVMDFVKCASYIDNKELVTIIKGISTKIDKRVAKALLGYFAGAGVSGAAAGLSSVSGIILAMLLLAYSGYHATKLGSDAEQASLEYAELFKKSISQVFIKSGLASKSGVKLNAEGKFDSSDLVKLVNTLNISRQSMLPQDIRAQLSRPDFRKTKQTITFDEKVAVVEKFKQEGQNIMNALGNTPSKLNNTLRYTLSAEMFANDNSTVYGGIPSENVLYGSLCENIMATIVDVFSVSFVLVRDLKRY